MLSPNLMKKNILLCLVLFLISFSGSAQEFSFGIKGGINYSLGGEIEGSTSNLNYWGGTATGEGAIGFQGGVFGQFNLGKFFLRPEIVYSTLNQEFDIPLRDTNTNYNVETLTVPFLIGYNIFGPVDIYLGPVYSNILGVELEGLENNRTVEAVQNTPVNAQVGIKVEYRRFGLDVRYEHSLSSAERQDLRFDNDGFFGGRNGGANNGWFNDARLNQLIVSLNFKIFDSSLNAGRRRGGSCYF